MRSRTPSSSASPWRPISREPRDEKAAARRRIPCARVPAGGVRARQLQPGGRVQAEQVGSDPPRAARPLDHAGSRLSVDRGRPDDPARGRADAVAPRAATGSPADGRRSAVRSHPDADRRTRPSVEGDRPLVPVRREPVPLHLGDQHARLHPLPLSGQTYHGIPVWGIYAATSSINVTLALALMTFLFTHIEGVRWNGAVRYFKSWIPGGLPKFSAGTAVLWGLIVFLEVLGQFMR